MMLSDRSAHITWVLLVNMHLNYFLMWSGWVHGNFNGPLVPMVRLVPIENDVIPLITSKTGNRHILKFSEGGGNAFATPRSST